MIRILYVMTTLDVGGAERSLLELVRRLDRSRFAPSVCSLMTGGRLVETFEASNVPVFELGVAGGVAELNGARIVPLLARVRPQIVHSRLILSNLWARLGRFRAKVISEERGLAEDRPRFMTLLDRWSSPLVTRQVANSHAVAERMRTRDRSSPVVIHGGIDTDRFYPGAKEPECDLVTVTRLERYKGVFDLVDAMREVVARRPGATLRIYGGGSKLAELTAKVREDGLAANIEVCGERADIPARLQEGRVFVLASHEEGLPNAVMEAMAAGLPVVATEVGGTPELVGPDTGMLVAARRPSELAAAILRYLGDRELRTAHGAAARAHAVAKLDVRTTVARYEALYQELVG